jgi:hypothetical protein
MRARDGQKRNAEHFQSQMEGRPALDASKEESVGRKKRLTLFLYFCNSRTMKQPDPLLVPRSAERFAALGAEPRLAILRLLLSDVEKVKPLVDGKLISAFVRAQRPNARGNAIGPSCCASTCCN